MNCPNCGARTVVYISRIGADSTIKRARKCPRCRLRMTTSEQIQESWRGRRKTGPKPARTTNTELSAATG